MKRARIRLIVMGEDSKIKLQELLNEVESLKKVIINNNEKLGLLTVHVGKLAMKVEKLTVEIQGLKEKENDLEELSKKFNIIGEKSPFAKSIENDAMLLSIPKIPEERQQITMNPQEENYYGRSAANLEQPNNDIVRNQNGENSIEATSTSHTEPGRMPDVQQQKLEQLRQRFVRRERPSETWWSTQLLKRK